MEHNMSPEYSDDEFDGEDENDSHSVTDKDMKDTFDPETDTVNSWFVESTEVEGMVRLKLKPLTQKILGCEVGENVTTEFPWMFVRTDVIEDNLDLHSKSSDFLPVRGQIMKYPERKILIGYAANSDDDDDEDQFNICLTEQSRDIVLNQIECLRFKQQSRMKNAILKSIGEWKDQGSSEEVEETLVRNTRALFETQVEIRRESLDLSVNLVNHNAEEQRDGYVELVPSRQSFNNVTRRLVSRGDQANPPSSDNETQTTTWTSINSGVQYSYDYKPINTTAYNEDEGQAIEKFLQKCTNLMCDKIQLNATWDLHTDDYLNLVRDEKDIKISVPVEYLEYQRYHDGKLTKEKVINDLCWHPLQTGIAFAAYTKYAKGQNLVGRGHRDKMLRACQGDNKVLMWSFNDCLTPKLILECPREVVAVSTRPLDGNLVVGGCANGQIAVWSIAEKIEKLEAIPVSSAAQVKYRTLMRSYMSWMKETTYSKSIYPTVMSSIQHSQKGPITEIMWLPAYSRLDENGRIVELEANSKVEELAWQFVTSSEDGTIAFWDLRVGEKIEHQHVPKRKWKKTKRQSEVEGLVGSISPFKALDGVFRPTYMLSVKYPSKERRVVITTMNLYVSKVRKVQVEPFSIDKNDIGTSQYYRTVIEKPEHETPKMILVGTLEGDVGWVTWDGFEFATGLKMNRDSVRWIWKNEGIHDGPVTHSVRSNYLNDVVLTIGGKAFAIWREDINEPVFLRKFNTRYTACCWGTSRPSVFMLARADGTVEIWDLIVRSNEPCFTQSLSGKIITAIHAHDLNINPQCIALCDFNGNMRLFTTPIDFMLFEVQNVQWMRQFIDQAVDRMKKLRQWEELWKEIERKKVHQQETQEKDCQMQMETPVPDTSEKFKSTKKYIRGKYIEDTRNHWKTMELMRMQRVILEKKGLRAEDLDKRREPVLKLRQEARKKKKRIRDMMQQRDRIFEDTVAFLLPERNYEHEQTTMTTWTTENEKFDNETNFIKHQGQEIIDEFKEISANALEKMKQNSYRHSFNWRDALAKGKERRRTIDVDLRKTLKQYHYNT